MAKSKSVRGSVSVFSQVAKTIRANRAEAIKHAATQQRLLALIKDDPLTSGLIEALSAAVKATGVSIKRKEGAERRKGNGNVPMLPAVADVALYLGRTYDFTPGAPQWEVLVRADITHLSGLKGDPYLERTLEAWLGEAEGQFCCGDVYRPAAVVTTEEEAVWHTRKYHMTWDFFGHTCSGFPEGGVRIKATLAAHVRSDSPTCRQEVVTTEEVVERKQYRLICA